MTIAFILFGAALVGDALSQNEPPARPRLAIAVSVRDENSIPIEGAQLSLVDSEGRVVGRAETDVAGAATIPAAAPGQWSLRAQKKGFYPLIHQVSVTESEPQTELDLVMSREQELSESVEVVYSPPAVDPAATESSREMSAQEIVRLPFSTTRDIRNALPLLSGVVKDNAGNIHIEGSASSEILTQLDGFNISNPASGLFDARISSDAVRSLKVETSRYSAEFGKYAGGLILMETGMGDDHFRFSATDFLPSVESTKGIHVNNWTPRATLSGPIAKRKAWFYQALDGEYGLDIIKELPEGADRNRTWRVSSLTKGQVNVARSHVVTGTLLLNRLETDHSGLSPFDPIETTVDQSRNMTLVGVRDQWLLGRLGVVDLALAGSSERSSDLPMGSLPFEIKGESTSGNFYKSESTEARRLQSSAVVALPLERWRGKHEVRFGLQADRLSFEGATARRPISLVDEQGNLLRDVRFDQASPFRLRTWDLGGFVQDRWSPRQDLLIEAGVRTDWDRLTGSTVASPRLAATLLLTEQTKVSTGYGIFYDSSDLKLLATPYSGIRQDTDFIGGIPEVTSLRFTAAPTRLALPRATHWSAGIERQARSVVFAASFLRKRGRQGWAYAPAGDPTASSLVYALTDSRKDSYYSAQLSVAADVRKQGRLTATYARSSARSTAVFEYDVDNVIRSSLTEGPQAWDTPHRLISSGWYPLPRRFEVSYSLDWRSGFPFSVINQRQELIGEPNARRFPTYFSLSVHLERRIRFANHEWALRVGANNLTNHVNPAAVNNNIDSPGFLTYSAIEDRAFVGRIRLIGKK